MKKLGSIYSLVLRWHAPNFYLKMLFTDLPALSVLDMINAFQTNILQTMFYLVSFVSRNKLRKHLKAKNIYNKYFKL